MGMAILATLFWIAVLLLLYAMVRPRCAWCGKRDWFWRLDSVVVGGAGPETMVSAYFHPECLHRKEE